MHKVAILIDGPSGSGKSTLAKNIIEKYLPDAIHLESDNNFMVNGEYKFDINKLGQAHRKCESDFRNAIQQGKSVIVSNTLTTLKEIRAYTSLVTSDYRVIYTYPKRAETMRVEDFNKSNIHNVPLETIERQHSRWNDLISKQIEILQEEVDLVTSDIFSSIEYFSFDK